MLREIAEQVSTGQAHETVESSSERKAYMSHQNAKRQSVETDIERSVRLKQDAARKANIAFVNRTSKRKRVEVVTQHITIASADAISLPRYRVLMISPVSVQSHTFLGVIGTRTPSSKRYKQIWFAFIAKFLRCISRNETYVVRCGLR